jgi:hypothetical protein
MRTPQSVLRSMTAWDHRHPRTSGGIRLTGFLLMAALNLVGGWVSLAATRDDG